MEAEAEVFGPVVVAAVVGGDSSEDCVLVTKSSVNVLVQQDVFVPQQYSV